MRRDVAANNRTSVQVQMVWPESLLKSPPPVELPSGYGLRTYRRGDEIQFYRMMALAGWVGWDDEKLKPWLYRVLPGGWFMAISEGSDGMVASSMATHDPTWLKPFCGEMGWTVTDPAHRGKGLGTAVASAVTGRFIDAGYQTIHLYTEPWRLAALKIYLKLGYVPLLDELSARDRWRGICRQLGFPFVPEKWESLC